MTLDEFVNTDVGIAAFREHSSWPKGAIGFRTLRGRVVWATADYPDGSNGNRVRVTRLVHEGGQVFNRACYYDRDTKIEFVYEEKK